MQKRQTRVGTRHLGAVAQGTYIRGVAFETSGEKFIAFYVNKVLG
jgi:hypothetical protein